MGARKGNPGSADLPVARALFQTSPREPGGLSAALGFGKSVGLHYTPVGLAALHPGNYAHAVPARTAPCQAFCQGRKDQHSLCNGRETEVWSPPGTTETLQAGLGTKVRVPQG